MAKVRIPVMHNGQPVLKVGTRVRVKPTAPYMHGHIGTVEKVGHEVVEVRLDMEPSGTTERVWPFDKSELEVLPKR